MYVAQVKIIFKKITGSIFGHKELISIFAAR